MPVGLTEGLRERWYSYIAVIMSTLASRMLYFYVNEMTHSFYQGLCPNYNSYILLGHERVFMSNNSFNTNIIKIAPLHYKKLSALALQSYLAYTWAKLELEVLYLQLYSAPTRTLVKLTKVLHKVKHLCA